MMLHQESNRSVLEAFHELATEELRKIPPPNVESLKGIGLSCLPRFTMLYELYMNILFEQAGSQVDNNIICLDFGSLNCM